MPTDMTGLPLPESSWPEARAAPGDLEIVRRFGNTTNRRNGADLLADVETANVWLRGENLQLRIKSADDLRRFVALRESLFAQIANSKPPADTLVEAPPLSIAGVEEGLALRLEPQSTDLLQLFTARLLLAVLFAQQADTWKRLKACRDCRWLVYDTSKNQSGKWCSSQRCGGRNRVRKHRERQRST